MAYDNTNSGALFTNKRKEKDTHPTHTGTANIDGVEYWVSAWVKTKQDGSGERYFSMSYKRKDSQPTRTPAPPPPAAGSFDFDDDVPF